MTTTVTERYPAGQLTYRIPFDYLARPFVVVTLVDTSVTPERTQVLRVVNDYSFNTSTEIQILADQTGFDTLQINRFTSSEPMVTFADGSVLTAKDLTVSELQAIHIAEEGRDLIDSYVRPAVEAIEDGIEIVKGYRDETENLYNEVIDALASAGDLDTLARLALPDGASLIGGGMVLVDTVAGVPAINPKNGQLVRTLFNKTTVTTDWKYVTAEPTNDPRFYIKSGDGWLIYLDPVADLVKMGLEPTDSYNFAAAWANTLLMRKVLRRKYYSTFTVKTPGNYRLCSSINPYRDNFTLHIATGVHIIGYYKDASEPATVLGQSGGMFDITPRVDPDAGDFTVLTEYWENIIIVLDGKLSTIFSSANAPQLHNNNCIGAHHVKRCYVIGKGGVEESDHRGINFDGDCEDCHVDIGYVRGTDDEGICMGVNAKTFGSIRVKYLGKLRHTGIAGLQLGVRVSGAVTGGIAQGGHVSVHIDHFEWNGVTKYPVVGVYGTKSCVVTFGVCVGATHAVRWANSETVKVLGGTFFNTDRIVSRADQGTGLHREVVIDGVTAGDNLLFTALLTEAATSKPLIARITNCDFSRAADSFMLYYDLVSSGSADRLPAIQSYKNNIVPTAFVGRVWSPIDGYSTGNIISPGATTATIDPAVYGYLAPKIEVTAYEATGNRTVQFTIDTRQRLASSSAMVHLVATKYVTSSKNASNVITLTCDTGVTLQIIQLRG